MHGWRGSVATPSRPAIQLEMRGILQFSVVGVAVYFQVELWKCESHDDVNEKKTIETDPFSYRTVEKLYT